MTFDEWYREHYTAHDSGLIATYSAAKAGWEAAIAASASAEPVGEFVGYQKVGFQQVSIIAWNRHVPMGTKLYDSPRPIEAPDNSQPVIADTAKSVADLFNAREVIAAMILENEDEGLTESTVKKARDIVYSPFSMPGAAKPVGYASQSELNHNDEEHPSHLYPTPSDEYAVPLYASPAIDAAPDNSQAVALSAEQERTLTGDRLCEIGYLYASYDDEPLFTFGRQELIKFVAHVKREEIESAALSAPTSMSAKNRPAQDDVQACHKCGLPKSVNPHPEAGKPPHYLEVGCPTECIPCLSKSRHGWAQRAMKDSRDAQRYRYLRNCGVIVDFTHAGPWKFTDDIDSAVDKFMARSAAIASQSAKEPRS